MTSGSSATPAAALLALLAAACGAGTRPGASALHIEVDASPPVLRVVDAAGAVVARSAPGAVRLARMAYAYQWQLGFLAVSSTEESVVDLAGGAARVSADGASVTLSTADGQDAVRLDVTADAGGLDLRPVLLAGAGDANQVRFRFACEDGQAFYGLGGQNDAVDHRGETVPVRTTEQGLGKDPTLAEGDFSIQGHLHDTYFPLPYVLVNRPDPDARAFGIVLDSPRRSRFLLGSDEPGVLEVQADADALDGLRILAGPAPADVVRQYTDLYGRPNPVPSWAFGPWVAFKGTPDEVAAGPAALDAADVPATAIWDQDDRDYGNPVLPAMIARIHAAGLRVLTYWNSFVDAQNGGFDEAVAKGYVPTSADGTPYVFAWGDDSRSLVDFTNPAAVDWMAGRLSASWDLGVDGFMADYGEWVAPDMHFADGRDGTAYANLYPVDWAAVNDRVLRAKRPAGDGLFFSRSGYLGSNRVLSVVWAGDQQTDFDPLDGLPSVIPYGTGLGLSGVSAFGHDIAGYTGLISPPSDAELYARWTELGAWSPVMRTHRGNSWQQNWDWDRDEGTIAIFRQYALLHLRLLPYLQALHAEAMRSGLPAMRSAVLEFPGWAGAARAVHEFLLGPAFFVAPVVEQGAATRVVDLPPGRWYRFPEGTPVAGGTTVVEDAPLSRIPVFLRAGGVAVLLPDTVRRAEPDPSRPDLPAASDLLPARLQVIVGAGAGGLLRLADDTRVQVRSGDAVAGVSRAAGTLSPCAAGADPWTDDCFLADGAGPIVPLDGNGAVRVGGTTVEVSGGPPGRRWRVQVVGEDAP